ncbi:hypothetical protein GCM10020000_16230 [Streptomyces olivoverticillatus]
MVASDPITAKPRTVCREVPTVAEARPVRERSMAVIAMPVSSVLARLAPSSG